MDSGLIIGRAAGPRLGRRSARLKPARSLPMTASPRERAKAFCHRFGLRLPILMAPMAGACPASLAAAVANAGGMGAFGAVLTPPAGIGDWAREFRASSNGSVQLNTWIPDPPPRRDAEAETKVREFLGQWGPPVPASAGDVEPPDFEAQCEAMLAAGPAVISSIMGVYPPKLVQAMKVRGIAWFANVTTLAEALQAEAA